MSDVSYGECKSAYIYRDERDKEVLVEKDLVNIYSHQFFSHRKLRKMLVIIPHFHHSNRFQTICSMKFILVD